MQIKDVGFRYDPSLPLLFSHAEMGIDSQSRIVLLGENGNGKTTLVKLIIGTAAPFTSDHPPATLPDAACKTLPDSSCNHT